MWEKLNESDNNIFTCGDFVDSRNATAHDGVEERQPETNIFLVKNCQNKFILYKSNLT
jgi:hypothetical protein